VETITRTMNEVKRLFDLPDYQLRNFPKEAMFVSKLEGSWTPITTEAFVDKALQLSKGLVGLGVSQGDCIGLVSSNRLEWNLMDIAIQQVGATVVPIYPNISSADYVYIFNDANLKYAFVGDASLYQKISAKKDQIPCLIELFTFDEVEGARNYWDIVELGASVDNYKVKELKANVRNEDLATIIYTSGTTGNPKGVMLSHNNILSNVFACSVIIPADSHSRVLTFLPTCHIYERMLHYLYMYVGASIYYAESMDTIGENIREVKPHVFTAVPRLLEKVFDRIMAKGDELRGIKRKLFFWSVGVAEKYEIRGNSLWYRIKLGIARKLVFSKWQEALGGEVKAIASGSAALQPRLARIFLAAGINVLEGYGLSETSPVISVNCLKRGICIGTVGPLIGNVKVKIAEDGEILVKGPNVMMGYYNLPDKTAEVIDSQGWFHTGDIGEFVDGFFLKITDRKKEIFKTSGGKYIVPQAMENKFKESRFIEQMMVIGEGQKYPAALIVPGFHFVREWSLRKGRDLSALSNEELIRQPEVIERIQQEVDKMNELYGSWEKIKKFCLLSKEWSVESGELTPTLKLKRKIILEKHKAEVASCFPEED
jgi:long-chain acyl-CoA synthetase